MRHLLRLGKLFRRSDASAVGKLIIFHANLLYQPGFPVTLLGLARRYGRRIPTHAQSLLSNKHDKYIRLRQHEHNGGVCRSFGYVIDRWAFLAQPELWDHLCKGGRLPCHENPLDKSGH